jgi:pilus assembly protein Flp/PilA
MKTKAKALLGTEEGVTSLEYALMAALIAAAIIGGVSLLGGGVGSQFSSVAGVI